MRMLIAEVELARESQQRPFGINLIFNPGGPAAYRR